MPDYLKKMEPQTTSARSSVPPMSTDSPSAASTPEDPYATCRRALDAAMAAGPLRFQPGRIAIHSSFARALDAVGALTPAGPRLPVAASSWWQLRQVGPDSFGR